MIRGIIMKKFILSTILITTILFGGPVASANTINNTDLMKLMPGMTTEEVNETIKETANSLGKSEKEIANQMLSELKVQENLTNQEKLKNTSKLTRSNGNGTRYVLEEAMYFGDVFYEPASTFSVQHGHVGIYWTKDIIVESIPDVGVRRLDRKSKKVEKGSYIFTFPSLSVATQDKSSNWAYARIGESYSYNFATNRVTSHYGAKNCSKLVWSAYMVQANLDLDSDGGLGVYPKDILNHSKATIYKEY